MNRESASAKLRAIAQIRIEQHLVSAQTETGEGLPSEVLNGVRNVLCGPRKTFRYMLFTGLLAAVSDKPYTDVDVNHACEKAMNAGVRKVIFAVGACAEKPRVQEGALIDVWAEKGIELSFLKISGILGAATAISDAEDRQVRLWYNIGWQTLVTKCDRSVK